MRNSAFFTALLCLFVFKSATLNASTRKAYFSAVGRNMVKSGLTAAESSKCIIFIRNSSSVDQKIKIDVSSSFSSLNNGANVSLATDPSTSVFTTVTAGNTLSYTAIFAAVPAATANQTQDITCAGSITVDDASPSTGHVNANASLVTFYEATPQSYVSGSIQAVFVNTNVTINGGNSF